MQPDPEKALFAIDPGDPPAAGNSQTSSLKLPTTMRAETVLRVRLLRVASPYNGQAFVYKTTGNEFRTDYYNGFIAAPDQLLTGSLIAWLLRAGPFDSVVDVASGIPARYVLEGNVTALYGDYSDKAIPKAVMVVRIFLLDDHDANLRIMFEKQYSATSAIERGNVNSLVKGWGIAFRQILEQMTADLRDLPLTDS